MNKITYDEYLEALEKVRRFHSQIENEVKETKDLIKVINAPANDVGIIALLHEKASTRLIDGVKYFLELETTYKKIPYATAEAVSISFFVERYTLKHLRALRNMGFGSLVLLDKILLEAGYSRLRQF